MEKREYKKFPEISPHNISKRQYDLIMKIIHDPHRIVSE